MLKLSIFDNATKINCFGIVEGKLGYIVIVSIKEHSEKAKKTPSNHIFFISEAAYQLF